MRSLGIELGTCRTEGRALTNCVILAQQGSFLCTHLSLSCQTIFDLTTQTKVIICGCYRKQLCGSDIIEVIFVRRFGEFWGVVVDVLDEDVDDCTGF